MRKLRVHSEQRWKSGKPIGAYDLLIAGQARHKLTFIA
jgi:predicted nucleic acid-binding protein